jgi:probable HAF family extracellular repeat protein
MACSDRSCRGLVALALLMGAQPVFGQSVSGQRVGAQKLSITDLGTLGGDYVHSMATDINSRGQVVGDSFPARSEKFRAFLWEDGKMTDLGTFPGGDDSGSVGFDINNHEQVVGYSTDVDLFTDRAFLWEDGKMTDLGGLPGSGGGIANGINNRGQVVGYSDTDSGTIHAVLWTK